MPAIKPLNRSTVKNYAYDNMNRLTSAAAADGHWSDSYTYDGWGNMKSKASVGGISIPNFGVNSLNQATAVYSYDVAGAGYVTQDGIASYGYDPEGHLLTTWPSSGGTYCYVYDGDGNRVEKGTLSGSTCTANTLYYRAGGSETINEASGSGVVTYRNIYFGGQMIDRMQIGGSIWHIIPDQIGSTRLTINASTLAVTGDVDYDPFGAVIAAPPGTADSSGNPYLFTGKERDTESGNDYFGARYYASTMGRFMSPDPKQISSKRLTDPQGWDMYAYARNNPLILIDPNGAEWEWAGARSDANAGALLTAFATAYRTDGLFRTNFDTVAKSTTTFVSLSDFAERSQFSPGETSNVKGAVQADKNGMPISVSNPFLVTEKLDVSSLMAYGDLNDLVRIVKHETQHADQWTTNPLATAILGATNMNALENPALNAQDSHLPTTSLTFGQALTHVLDAIYHPPTPQTETPVLEVQIPEIKQQ